MNTPITPLDETPQGAENSPDLNANLEKLEAIFNGRHKTDHIFMNWWVGSFLMNPVTLGGYIAYRFIRGLYRRNQHFQRTLAFYQLLPQILRQLPQSTEKLAGETVELLEDYENWLASEEANQLNKPLHWKPMAIVWGVLIIMLIVYYAFLFSLGFSQAMAGGNTPDPVAIQKTMLSVQPYTMVLNVVLYPFCLYWYYMKYRLLKDYPQLDTMESKFLSYLEPVLQKLSGENKLQLPFEPQCKARNFWLHLLLLMPTLGINFTYLDYCCIHEAQRRFKESARVQYRILKVVKKLAGLNNPIAALEVGKATTEESI